MSVNNVSGAQPQKPVIPAELQAQLEKAKPEERQGIFAKFLQENASNTEVFNNVLSFMNEEAKAEVQQARADQHQKDVAEMEAAKKASQAEQRKADMASDNPATSALAAKTQAQANLDQAKALLEKDPDNQQLKDQVAQKEAELSAAQQNLDALQSSNGNTLEISQEKGVKTNAKGEEVEFSRTTVQYDLEAPGQGDDVGKKWTKDDARAEFNRYTNNTDHDFQIKDKNGNVIKTIKPGEEVAGDDLKALKKQVEADYKALKKEYEAELKKEPRDFEKVGQLYEQVRAAYNEKETIKGAESGKGIGRITKRHNQNVKANERLRDTQVFYSKEEEKAAKEAAKAAGQEIKTKVCEPRDLAVVQQLASLAKSKIENAKNDDERAQLEQTWGELRDMCFDKDGNPIQGNPDPDKVKDALTNITGSDRSLDISEMKTVAKETGCSEGDVRHAFRAFGFEAQRPFGRKLVNGLKAAAPIAIAEGLGQLLSRNKKTAEAHSEATDSHSAYAESIVTNTEHHTVNLSADGKSVTYINPETGREETLELAGISQDFEFDTSATAKAVAYAESFAHASADAVASVVAHAGPVAYLGALIAGAIGFCKTPTEKGVADGTEMYKLAQLTSVYKAPQDKKIASQIHQMIGRITGDRAMDAAIIQSVLERDSGDQNTVLTTRELEGAYQNLKDIQSRYQNYTPAEVTDVQEPEPPAQPPVVDEPEPEPEHEVVTESVVYQIQPGNTLGTIAKAMYPGLDQNKVIAELAKANNLNNKNSILAGDQLVLPVIDGVEPAADGKPGVSRGGRRVKHNFGRGDGQGTRTRTVYEGADHPGTNPTHSGERVKSRTEEQYTVPRRRPKQ